MGSRARRDGQDQTEEADRPLIVGARAAQAPAGSELVPDFDLDRVSRSEPGIIHLSFSNGRMPFGNDRYSRRASKPRGRRGVRARREITTGRMGLATSVARSFACGSTASRLVCSQCGGAYVVAVRPARRFACSRQSFIAFRR